MFIIDHVPNPHLLMHLVVIRVHIIADSDIASCIMLASMTTKLQSQHETMEAYDIVIRLREVVEKHVIS